MRWLLVVLLAALVAFKVQAADKPKGKKTELTSIQGLSLTTEAKLNAAGINNVNDLLEEGATPEGREEVAVRSGLAAEQILKFVNCADLLRINGIAGPTTALLAAVGVNTVAELARRDSSTLQLKLQEVSDARKLTGKVPTEKEVAEWIDAAKALPKKVSY